MRATAKRRRKINSISLARKRLACRTIFEFIKYILCKWGSLFDSELSHNQTEKWTWICFSNANMNIWIYKINKKELRYFWSAFECGLVISLHYFCDVRIRYGNYIFSHRKNRERWHWNCGWAGSVQCSRSPYPNDIFLNHKQLCGRCRSERSIIHHRLNPIYVNIVCFFVCLFENVLLTISRNI